MSGAGADAQKKREWQAVIDEMTKLLSKKATERLIDKQLSEIFLTAGGGMCFLCVDGGGAYSWQAYPWFSQTRPSMKHRPARNYAPVPVSQSAYPHPFAGLPNP